MKTKIAGVTFRNEAEDGGISRQVILGQLYETAPRHMITVDLKETTFEGERAIKCMEHKTKQCIGWIPKVNIPSVINKQMTGFINKSARGFSVILDEQKKPTSKQYQMIKHICEKTGKPMPAYDVRAYVDLFEKYRRG